MNNSRFKLGIIELFYPIRHEELYNIKEHSKNGYYLCSLNISIRNFFNKTLIDLLYQTHILFYNKSFINNGLCYHYFHPNFENIVKNENYFNIKIIEIFYIDNKEIIVDKTFFLKLLQKKWKKYYYNLI